MILRLGAIPCLLLVTNPLHAQQSDRPGSPRIEDQAQFEVATVKPSDPEECCARTWNRRGRHFEANDMYLKYLIQWAWSLQANQVIGGPAWIDKDRFDIVGEIEGTDAPTDHEWKMAMQQLLADRFQLKTHTDTREMQAYALTVAKGGPKLTPGDGDTHVQQMGFSGSVGAPMYARGKNASIADFIGELQRIVLSRPVIDRTGLTGRYDIALDFTREDANAIGMAELPDNQPPNLFNALTQQLGLKLELTRGPVPVLVIDSAARPSDN